VMKDWRSLAKEPEPVLWTRLLNIQSMVRKLCPLGICQMLSTLARLDVMRLRALLLRLPSLTYLIAGLPNQVKWTVGGWRMISMPYQHLLRANLRRFVVDLLLYIIELMPLYQEWEDMRITFGGRTGWSTHFWMTVISPQRRLMRI